MSLFLTSSKIFEEGIHSYKGQIEQGITERLDEEVSTALGGASFYLTERF